MAGAAGPYAVSFDPSVNTPTRNGVQGAVVYAGSDLDAKAMLEALHGDEVTIGWENADYDLMAASADMEGWTFRVVVHKADGSVVADVTVTGAASATVDSIAGAMGTALAAVAATSHAAYNSGTNVLTVAGAADNLGDGHVYAAFSAPGSTVPVPGFVGTITQEGSSGSALTVALAADAYTVPSMTKAFADRSN